MKWMSEHAEAMGREEVDQGPRSMIRAWNQEEELEMDECKIGRLQRRLNCS